MALRILYEGHVQGVGFRWAVKQIAKGFDVVGSVANLADGRVELQVDGELTEIRDFVQAIAESDLRSHIRGTTETELDQALSRRGFEIRHE